MTTKQTTQNWEAIQKAIQAKKAAKTKLETSPLIEAPAVLAAEAKAVSELIQTPAPIAPTPAPIVSAPTSTPVAPSMVLAPEYEELIALKDENAKLAQELEGLKTKITHAKNGFNELLAKEKEASARKLADKTAEVQGLTAQVDGLRTDLESVSKENAENVSKLAKLATSAKEDVDTTVDQLTPNLDANNARILELLDEVDAKEDQVGKLSLDLDAKKARMLELLDEVDAKESQITELTKQVATLSSDLESKNATMLELLDEADAKDEKIVELEANVQELEKELEEAEKGNQEMKKLKASGIMAKHLADNSIIEAAKELEPDYFASALTAYAECTDPEISELVSKAKEILDNVNVYEVLVVASGLMSNKLDVSVELLGDRFQSAFDTLLQNNGLNDQEIMKALETLKQ